MEAHLVVLVVVVRTLGVALPGPGRTIDRAGAIEPTLALLVATTGLGIDAEARWSVRSRWARLSVTLAVSTVVLPLLAWAVGHMTAQPARAGVLVLLLGAGVARVRAAR